MTIRCLLLANGDQPSDNLLLKQHKKCKVFVVTDGAANNLKERGLTPQFIVGDFDSLDPAVRKQFPHADFIRAADQESCDLEKALKMIFEMGIKRVILLGAGGGRFDHTLTTLSVMQKFSTRMDIRMRDEDSETRVITGKARFSGHSGDTISLVAFERVDGITLDGVKWPLKEETLLPGSRGISNVFKGKLVNLSVHRGFLVVCHRLCN